jgi:hypothetical protein
MDALPIMQRCLFCTWAWEGTALEGRTRAIAHRLKDHPEIKPALRRNGRNLKSFRQSRIKPEQALEISTERDKRARLLGIDVE